LPSGSVKRGLSPSVFGLSTPILLCKCSFGDSMIFTGGLKAFSAHDTCLTPLMEADQLRLFVEVAGSGTVAF
jgi:hypothetical protein